jgi:hypothetical protein
VSAAPGYPINAKEEKKRNGCVNIRVESAAGLTLSLIYVEKRAMEDVSQHT